MTDYPLEKCGEPYGHESHVWDVYGEEGWEHRCPGVPHPDTARIQRAITVLDRLEDGAAATPGRDFGRGVAHATRQIREALNGA